MKKVVAFDETLITWYIRDAQGNIMTTYSSVDDNPELMLAEVSLYGSSRLGLLTINKNISALNDGNIKIHTLREKLYEISNHLGNVLTTVSDKKAVDIENNGLADQYTADIQSTNDYYPFGSPLPGRGFDARSYKFGFNGQEKDDEIAGEGNHSDFKFRGYDPRVGRFWSVDPLAREFPWNSPYCFAENDVISAIELEGLEKIRLASNVKFNAGLLLALKVLDNTDIGRQLKNIITNPNINKQYDVLIYTYYNGDAGGQVQPVSINPNGTNWVGSGVSSTLGLTSIAKKHEPLRQGVNPNDYKESFENNRDVIQIGIVKDPLNFVVSNMKNGNKEAVRNAIAGIAFVLYHEGAFHAKNNIMGIDKSATTEHQEGYSDSTISGDTSPSYEDIKPSSPAGKAKDQIEESSKKIIK